MEVHACPERIARASRCRGSAGTRTAETSRSREVPRPVRECRVSEENKLEQIREDALPGLAQIVPRVVALIAVVEALIMIVLARVPAMPPIVETAVDAMSLSLVSAPLMYFWIVRPLRLRLETHMRAEADFSAAMRASAGRLQSVLETAPDGIVVIDERGLIQSANHAVEEIFGWPVAELAGQRVTMLMRDEDARAHDGHVQRFTRGEGRGKVGLRNGRRLVGRRRDGTTLPVGVHVNETIVEGRRLFTGVLRDLTDEVKREEQLREQLERVSALQRVSTIVAREGDVSELIAEVMTTLRGVLHPDRSIAALVSESGELRVESEENITPMQKAGMMRVRPWERLPADVDHLVLEDLRAIVDPENCEGCGTCLSRCQMDAIAVPDGAALMERSRCIGCALCVTTCPSDAIRLEANEPVKTPPDDTKSLYMQMLQDRYGAWGMAKIGVRKMLGMKV